MRKIIIVLCIALTSCTKAVITPNETTAVVSEGVNSCPPSIMGTWLPIDDCRINLRESFTITDSTFRWSLGAFGTTYHALASIGSDDDVYHFYTLGDRTITLYSRVAIGGEPIPNNGYRQTDTFVLYATLTNLIFETFTYKH